MNVRRTLVCGFLIALSSVAAWRCYAQYEVEPDSRPNREAYRVRVINEMGRAICVKIIPTGKSTYFHADMRRGETVTQNLYAGQRVLCVWDDNTGDLLVASGVLINRNGKLRVRPMFAMAPKAAESGSDAPAEAPRIPSIEIEAE